MHKICKVDTALVITFCRWNKSLSRLRFFGRVHKDINLHKHPHSYGNRFITYEVPSRHRTLPVLNLTKPYAAGWNENDLLLHSEKIREKWQDRQSPGARWKRQEKSCRWIRSRDDDNSGRRRRDESNWRKEGPDAAQREERMERTRTRNVKWQEYWLHGTNETTHN